MAREDADFLNVEPSTLAKIGSALVHAEELLSPGGHEFDLEAFRRLMEDKEVVAWLDSGRAMAMLPVKR